MKQITFEQAFYIKLGEGGKDERECLDNNYLKIGYRKVPHELCLAGKWNEVQKSANHKRQIQTFYEANEACIWISFIYEKLYWCRADNEVKVLEDGSKTRAVVGKWSCNDINGNELSEKKLSGKITKTKGYRGTICPIKGDALTYLKNKINGKKSPELENAIDAKNDLESRISKLLTHLQPYDFEILVELIFTRAGLQKISQTGGTQKGIDIRLYSPITNETYFVQVKSKSDYAEYLNYKQMAEGYSRFFFVVHSPKEDLSERKKSEPEQEEDGRHQLLLAEDVAKLAVKYGLADWIIDKSG